MSIELFFCYSRGKKTYLLYLSNAKPILLLLNNRKVMSGVLATVTFIFFVLQNHVLFVAKKKNVSSFVHDSTVTHLEFCAVPKLFWMTI